MALNEHQKDTDLFGGSLILRHTQIKDHRVRRTVKILFLVVRVGTFGASPSHEKSTRAELAVATFI